jgi:hypothetical protein
MRAELELLQRPRRYAEQLRRLTAQARATLRRTKCQVELELEQAGLKFHGRAIRRPR